MLDNTTGSRNAALGYQALLTNTTGADNTAVGAQAIYQVVSGIRNTAIGYLAGSSYTANEGNNISLGDNVTGTAAESNVIRIGTGITACYITGINGATSTGGVAGILRSIRSIGYIIHTITKTLDNRSPRNRYLTAPVRLNYPTSKNDLFLQPCDRQRRVSGYSCYRRRGG